jgi:DNA-binding NtrC family response regulator
MPLVLWLTFSVGTTLAHVERRTIEPTIRHCNGDRSLAANLLGITARTVSRREAEWRDARPSGGQGAESV